LQGSGEPVRNFTNKGLRCIEGGRGERRERKGGGKKLGETKRGRDRAERKKKIEATIAKNMRVPSWNRSSAQKQQGEEELEKV